MYDFEDPDYGRDKEPSQEEIARWYKTQEKRNALICGSSEKNHTLSDAQWEELEEFINGIANRDLRHSADKAKSLLAKLGMETFKPRDIS